MNTTFEVIKTSGVGSARYIEYKCKMTFEGTYEAWETIKKTLTDAGFEIT